MKKLARKCLSYLEVLGRYAMQKYGIEVFQCWGYPEGCPFFMADNSRKVLTLLCFLSLSGNNRRAE